MNPRFRAPALPVPRSSPSVPFRMRGPLTPQRTITVQPHPQALDKYEKLRAGARHDALDPILVRFASRLVRAYPPDSWLAMAREIFRWVRDGIRYQHDPGGQEEFAPATVVLERGYDDCDGKVRLAVALMRAVGIDADVSPVWEQGHLSHVQLKLRFPGSRKIAGNVDGWIYGEMTIRGAELTQNPFAIASNPETGKLPLSGGPPPRYLRESPLD